MTVTARADEGLRFAEGTTTKWTFTFEVPTACEDDIAPVSTPILTDLPTLAVTGANDSAGIVGLVALLLTLTGLGMVAARRRVEV